MHTFTAQFLFYLFNKKVPARSQSRKNLILFTLKENIKASHEMYQKKKKGKKSGTDVQVRLAETDLAYMRPLSLFMVCSSTIPLKSLCNFLFHPSQHTHVYTYIQYIGMVQAYFSNSIDYSIKKLAHKLRNCRKLLAIQKM